MSDDRVENGEDMGENGALSFTLTAIHPDFDISCQMSIEGMAAGSAVRMMQRTYGHVMSNEAASAGINRDKDKYPDLDAFLKQWRTNKRAQIVSGEYTTRQTGPRISDDDKEKRRLYNVKLLVPRWVQAGNPENKFPVSPKAVLGPRSLEDWWSYFDTQDRYENLRVEAKANVAKAKEQAAAARAELAKKPAGTDAFADL